MEDIRKVRLVQRTLAIDIELGVMMDEEVYNGDRDKVTRLTTNLADEISALLAERMRETHGLVVVEPARFEVEVR